MRPTFWVCMDPLLSNGSDCAPTSSCMEYCLASILLFSLRIEELDLDQFETWTSQHVIHIIELLSSIAILSLSFAIKRVFPRIISSTNDIFSLGNCDHRFCPINSFPSPIVSPTFHYLLFHQLFIKFIFDGLHSQLTLKLYYSRVNQMQEL